MKCPNCGKELKDGAKFCGACGTKITGKASGKKKKGLFASIFKTIKGKEKKKPLAKEGAYEREDIETSGSSLHWNILPGQLAVKIDYKTLGKCDGVNGIVIQEGTRAVVFADGAFVAEMQGGRYEFKSSAPVGALKPDAGFRSVVSRLLGLSGADKAKKLEGKTDIAIVLIRNATFPLFFECEKVQTASISANVAAHVLAKISNIMEFYKQLLLDREFVSLDFMAKSLEQVCRSCVERLAASIPAENIGQAQNADSLKASLASSVQSVFPFIAVESVVRLAASNPDLEELQAMREELYVDEERMKILQKRNDFLNRLADVNNAKLLEQAKSQSELAAAVEKIDEQNLLTQEEKSRFASTLAAQRQIRQATNDSEVSAALSELQKAAILRDEEIDALKAQVANRQAMQQLSDVQAIKLATLQNEQILDEEKLAWEIEVGNKRIENEVERKKIWDEYNDARRQADADFANAQRKTTIELDKEEQLGQLEILRQAQAIRKEREDAEHQRAMESKKAETDANLEMTKVYAGMSVEQIMAANPNLSPQAAAALAAKFSNDNAVDAQKQVTAAMQQFMTQMQSDRTAEREQQAQFMQILANQNNVQMQQMGAMAGNVAAAMGNAIAGNANNAAAPAQPTQAAQVAQPSQPVRPVQVTQVVQPVQPAVQPTQPAQPTQQQAMPAQQQAAATKCPNCGALLEHGASFCGECGASV